MQLLSLDNICGMQELMQETQYLQNLKFEEMETHM